MSIIPRVNPVFLPETASPLQTARSPVLHPWQMRNQTNRKSYLENMKTYWTTLAIQAVLTEGDFHTAFARSCRNGEGKAGIGMEGGEVPATSSI